MGSVTPNGVTLPQQPLDVQARPTKPSAEPAAISTLSTTGSVTPNGAAVEEQPLDVQTRPPKSKAKSSATAALSTAGPRTPNGTTDPQQPLDVHIQPAKSKAKNSATSTPSTPGSVTPNGVKEQPLDVQALPTKPITEPYKFLHDKLKRRMTRPDKTPLVLVACGSFSPISVLHLQMFEMTERYTEDTNFEVVGSYLSPVSDAYKKPHLVPAHNRLVMCTLAVEGTANLMVDSWEALRHNEAGEPLYTKTVNVLRHFDHEINDILGGIQAPDGTFKRVQIVLLIGADVAITMGDPDIWATSDVDQILGIFGAFIVERPAQTNIDQALGPLKRYEKIWVVPSFYNDVSSTKIRNQLRNGESVEDLPNKVIEYIRSQDLYYGESPHKNSEGK